MSCRRTKNRVCLFFLSLFFLSAAANNISAQSRIISGQVVNNADQSHLPFVLLHFDDGKTGTTSDSQGNFSFPDSVRKVRFSCTGFKPLSIQVNKGWNPNLAIRLIPDNSSTKFNSNKGDNPSYRIMQSVLEHSDENNPAGLESYQFTSSHSFLLSTELFSKDKPNGKKKISSVEFENLQKRFEASHMFSIETVSNKKFLHPKHENEEIMSSKMAGLKKEVFMLLSSQLQGLSIYDEHCSLLDSKYLSPISKTALKYYSFVVEDTVVVSPQDTTFLIRFYPSGNHKFDGLKGFLHISSNNSAVRNIFAEPAVLDKKQVFASIWQHFDQIDSGHWFPAQMNASSNFKMVTALLLDAKKNLGKPVELSVTAFSQTQLSRKIVNMPLDPKSFPKYGVTVSPEKKDSLFEFRVFRSIPLETNDSLTNHYLDSLERNARLSQKVKLIHALSLGTIPIGVVSVNYTYLFGYNINEGYKVGLGIESNRKLSKYLATGLYFTYGTRDGQFRHGEWLRIYPTGYADFKIELGHKDVKKEFGVEEMLTDFDIFEPEYYRSLLVNNMYYTNNYYGSIEIRPIEPLNTKFFADYAYNSKNSYGNFSDMEWDPFRLTRIGFELRYSPGISFLNDPEELIQNAPPKSDFYLTVIQGLKLLESAYQFTKIDSKAKFDIRLSAFGTTSLMFRGGKIFNASPITEWFHGYGSYPGAFTLLAHYAFATMRLNEFSADQYAALHIRHNFGSRFIPSWYFFRPELSLAQNIGFGSLQQNYQAESGTTDFRKGFFESGIELNKIININFIGLGIGTYYRYGPYRFNTAMENFAYKFTLNFKF
jgi:hypothetical protein